MYSSYDFIIREKLKENMDCYKKKLIDKYNRANSSSKRKLISRELVDFSSIYKCLFEEEDDLVWDNDDDIYDDCDKMEYQTFDKFLDNIRQDKDFYLDLSSNVIDSYIGVKYPFYKYYNGSFLYAPKLDRNAMLVNMLSFFKCFDYENYQDMYNKIFNLELLQMDLDYGFSGAAFNFASINKSFILLSTFLEENVYKYETIVHEYGHLFEMQLFQYNNNQALIDRGLETPYYEIASSFFEYAFLNYLKDNKLYPNYVNQSLDNYYKELLDHTFEINLLSKINKLEFDEDMCTCITDNSVIQYGEDIKQKLNYYELLNRNEVVNFKMPYIYGVGKLFSIYLYENYKENTNFLEEFKKSLILYPLVNDISVFNNVGINKEVLLKGDTLKKVLKKHCDEF